MRIKHQPPPQLPQAYQAPVTYKGPQGLGARQAEIAARLRQQGQSGQARGGKRRKGGSGGIADSELVTEFEAAMDEAYDRITGRQQRHKQGGEHDDVPEEEREEDGDKPRGLPAAFRFAPVRLKG